ncbi:MAG: TerB family tellurite resistance protein [Flavobacteriales bacterium]|nr:TerB family tellurite resistance protein [Flavobacteriales bacterium]
MSEENEKLGLLAQLVQLAQSDDHFKEQEFQFLLAIAAQMGVTKEDFKQIFEENIRFQPPKFEAERILQLQRLILLMNVDKEISEEELDYIKSAGIRMGLHPSATNSVLSEMHNYKNNIIPPERLIEIFRTYHN